MPIARWPRLILLAVILPLLLIALLSARMAHGAGAPAPAPAPAAVVSLAYALPPFGPVQVLRPAREPRGVALFLSDVHGAAAPEQAIAQALARHDMLVALVSTPALLRHIAVAKARCVNLNYALVDLSRDVQHRAGLARFHKPLLMGLGNGAAAAYASLSQWANGSYAGVVSLGLRTAIATPLPWCAAPGFAARRVGSTWRLAPNRRIRLPWLILQPRSPGQSLTRFVAAVPHARLIPVVSGMGGWMAPLVHAVDLLAPRQRPDAALPVPDMPLTLVPAPPGRSHRDLMAVIYSGDGGWVGIDRAVAGQLAAAGVPVVGVDSLSYFWTARTPAGAGRDLSRLVNAFGRRWGRRRVLLIGYSFGADILPHMIERMDPSARASIARVALLGLGPTADFQFHLGSWLDLDSDSALPTVPAVVRLKGLAIQCVRGAAEDDSACPAIPPGLVDQYRVPGGHHFDRNAGLLARIILSRRGADEGVSRFRLPAPVAIFPLPRPHSHAQSLPVAARGGSDRA